MAERTATRVEATTPREPVSDPSASDEGGARCAGLREELRRHEVEIILGALRAAAWNQTEAAKRLGLPRRTLVYKLRALGIGKAYGARDAAPSKRPLEPG